MWVHEYWYCHQSIQSSYKVAMLPSLCNKCITVIAWIHCLNEHAICVLYTCVMVCVKV